MNYDITFCEGKNCARNFICDFILGKEQTNTIKTLFD